MPARTINKCKLFLNFTPCGHCGEDCHENSHSVYCEICCKWFHIKCKQITVNEYNEMSIDNHMFICSDKCKVAPFPFTKIDDIDLKCALYGEGLYPCKYCRRDCLDGMNCLQCDVCDEWYHIECTLYEDADAYDVIVDNDYEFICSEKCYMHLLPFCNFKYGTLVKANILRGPSIRNIITSQSTTNLRTTIPKAYTKESLKNFVKFDHFLNINCSHISPNVLNDSHLGNENSEITVFHNNIRSSVKNFDKISEETFKNCKYLPDILTITETKLNDSKSIPELEGYKYKHVDSTTDAGGVGIYLSNNLSFTVRNDLSLEAQNCEDLWINVDMDDGSKLVIGVVYRHPGHKYETFCDKLCNNLNSLNLSKTNYLVVGDFNINLLKYGIAGNVTNYVNALNSVGCNICIDRPTRVDTKSSTCIDHVYSNFSPDKLDTQIILSDVSDHFSTMTKISGVSKTKHNVDIFTRKSNLKDEEWEQFNLELLGELNKELTSNSEQYDVQESAKAITKAYNTVIDKFMPLTKMSKKQKRNFSKPWITPGLKVSSEKKFELLDKWVSTKLPKDREAYKKHLNMFNKLKKKAREDYYVNKAALYCLDKSKTWQLINEISMRKRKKRTQVQSIRNKNGKKLRDPSAIANCLNTHFGTVGKDLAKNLDQSKSDIQDPIEYIKIIQQQSMYLNETDSSELLKLISKLELKKACGYDHISNRILKATSYVIAPYLATLYNNCIKQGIFPDEYKVAQVIPLYKGGDQEDLNSYRPISLLPVFGKLFEKVISIRTISFLNKFELLSPHQFGFREKFSTEYAVLDIHEKLLKNLDDGVSSCAIFLDLAKAFDCVSHDILLRKLEKYGIRGNVYKLFKSYLSSRSQYVKLDNTVSSFIDIVFGVPQGSILGPLLFLIYINDLPEASHFFIRLFADDTFLCAQDSELWRLENNVNTELSKVYKWLVSNKLTLNYDKCKFMIVSKKKKTSNLSIKINHKDLKQCDTYKYLGVYVDKKLSWKPHIDYICKKISKACGALSKTRHCVGIETLKNIYYALVNSYIRYGISSWGNASPEVLKPLNVLNNRVVCIMSFAPLGRVNPRRIYKHLNILDVNTTFLLETGKFIFKSKNDLIPISTIAKHFNRTMPNQHHYNLRSRENQSSVVPIVLRSEHAQKSIQIQESDLWNDIPAEIRSNESLKGFKNQYKKFLLEKL